ncbi:hypothetical protein [Pseudoxanthomonas mexicana]
MDLRAVLTGDLVDASRASNASAYIQHLKSVLHQVSQSIPSSFDNFRGDGFQLVPNAPADAFRCAVLIRAGLIAASPTKDRWDARIAISVEKSDEDVLGEAFVSSGRTLDRMSSKSPNLVFKSSIRPLSESYELSTELISDFIDSWTKTEAEIYFTYALLGAGDHSGVAKQLSKSRSTISKGLSRAKSKLIDKFIDNTSRSIRKLSNG